MSNAEQPPLKVGEYTLNTQPGADIGNTYSLNGGRWRLVQVNSLAISAAGGKCVTRIYGTSSQASYPNGPSGQPIWKVAECVAAANLDFTGGIPIVGAINSLLASTVNSLSQGTISSLTLISALSYLLVQTQGPGVVAAGNTTIVAPAVFTTATANAGVQSVDTTTAGYGAVYGQALNTAAASAAGVPIACILKLADG